MRYYIYIVNKYLVSPVLSIFPVLFKIPCTVDLFLLWNSSVGFTETYLNHITIFL